MSSNTYFQFKKFTVRHDLCAMKVGTDGTLLGAWASCSDDVRTILDVGTGSGLIALMLAQRSAGIVDAVDIDARACRQARINFMASPFASRLRVFHQDFLKYESPRQSYDLIVSNPPYFIRSLPSPDRQRTTARHAGELPWQGLITQSYRLLSPAGRLVLIVPANSFDRVQDFAFLAGFYSGRATWVSGVEDRPPKRVMLEYGKCFQPPVEDRICIKRADRSFSPAYVSLMKTYYLDME
jgi:tRNA1Val (adenine37-N6)-methyltransferase